MSETGQMTFTMNELMVISSALEAQIDDCQEFLTVPNLSIEEKVKLNQVIQHSKSAAARLDAILEEININDF